MSTGACSQYVSVGLRVEDDGDPCVKCSRPFADHPETPVVADPPVGTAANEVQVGGEHYKTGGEEHWDRMWRLYGRGYFVGQITKYVERYHKKDGLKDLKKAAHFVQKLIELEAAAATGGVKPGEEYKLKK